MSCLGVHFSLSDEEVRKLKSFEDDADRLDYVQCDIEETYFEEHEDRMAQTDKSWDAMHRLLSDGDLSYISGPYPLRLAVMGGEQVYREADYIMSLKTPAEVKDIAQALLPITQAEFRRRYDAMDSVKYDFPKSEEDFQYTWDSFKGVVTFYQKAASENRWVLFSVDQ